MAELRQRNVPSASAASPSRPEGPSDISPAVPTSVIFKLLFFVVSLVTVPLGTYFITLNTVFKGNSSWAGGLAAFVANAILIGYLIVTIWDDYSEGEQEKKEKDEKSRREGKKFD